MKLQRKKMILKDKWPGKIAWKVITVTTSGL